ncbi:RloB family protein [Rhodococcus erythropolis]|uniref:RloB family protein n=1 Tax=Rhodococcus erythropolis TaxID=1833 RepID=UPI004042B654
MPRRSMRRRDLNKRGLVVTEGTVTEKQYVESLAQHLRQSSAVISVTSVGVGKDPLEVVKKCIERREDAKRKQKAYHWCVCLVDRDKHTTIEAAGRLAASEEIILLVTNLKFEMWLLWHLVDVRSPQSTTELDRLMIKHKLLQGKHLPLRFPIDKVHSAMKVAEAVDPNLAQGRVGPDPSSAIPILVQLMLNS